MVPQVSSVEPHPSPRNAQSRQRGAGARRAARPSRSSRRGRCAASGSHPRAPRSGRAGEKVAAHSATGGRQRRFCGQRPTSATRCRTERHGDRDRAIELDDRRWRDSRAPRRARDARPVGSSRPRAGVAGGDRACNA
jgi:hypothetical protein